MIHDPERAAMDFEILRRQKVAIDQHRMALHHVLRDTLQFIMVIQGDPDRANDVSILGAQIDAAAGRETGTFIEQFNAAFTAALEEFYRLGGTDEELSIGGGEM